VRHHGGVSERLLTAIGTVAAVAAVVAAFALLFSVLDSGGAASPPATVLAVRPGGARVAAKKVRVPAGKTAAGQKASPGHAAVGTKAPRRGNTARPAAAPVESPTLLGRPRRGPAFQIAHLREGARVDLESAPNGPIVAKLGDKTEFGSQVSFSVVETNPGWLGVTAPEMPNGQIGWIARDPSKVDVYWTRYSLHADLDGRSLELRYGDKSVRRFEVTVGGPGTETPPGRYGVTDGVSFDESPYYGCCALALSGHQTAELPAGWIGGNRLAIHGTPGAVGGAESLGCIRATDETMRFLFHRIPLGTPVFVSE
jgi:L,D-transpeptidase catalytic domain